MLALVPALTLECILSYRPTIYLHSVHDLWASWSARPRADSSCWMRRADCSSCLCPTLGGAAVGTRVCLTATSPSYCLQVLNGGVNYIQVGAC